MSEGIFKTEKLLFYAKKILDTRVVNPTFWSEAFLLFDKNITGNWQDYQSLVSLLELAKSLVEAKVNTNLNDVLLEIRNKKEFLLQFISSINNLDFQDISKSKENVLSLYQSFPREKSKRLT